MGQISVEIYESPGSVLSGNQHPATFYKLTAKYGGMELFEATPLEQLAGENAKLKRLLANAMLDNVFLMDLLGEP